MNLILCGFKHCGKSYFGEKLGKLLDRPFIDTDALIQKLYGVEGATCGDIYRHLGEAAFRELETQVLKALVPDKDRIISVGGGAVLNPQNIPLLQTLGTLVYLVVDEATLKERTLEHPCPAFLDPMDRERSFERLYKEKEPRYASLDAIPLLLSGKSDATILKELSTLIHAGTYGQ